MEKLAQKFRDDATYWKREGDITADTDSHYREWCYGQYAAFTLAWQTVEVTQP